MEAGKSSINTPKYPFNITGFGMYLHSMVETAEEQSLFNEGDLIYLIGIGAGLSIASALIRV
jgi:hypothetical protein